LTPDGPLYSIFLNDIREVMHIIKQNYLPSPLTILHRVQENLKLILVVSSFEGLTASPNTTPASSGYSFHRTLSAIEFGCSAAYDVVVRDGEWQAEYFEFDPEAVVETVER
jgi:hypothetical protein